jgi:hypothetical protein
MHCALKLARESGFGSWSILARALSHKFGTRFPGDSVAVHMNYRFLRAYGSNCDYLVEEIDQS